MVLDQGRLVEFDTPINLLNDKDGLLYSMVAATGAKSAEYLRKIAMGQLAVVDVIRESASEQEEDSSSMLIEVDHSFVEKQQRKESNSSSNSSSSSSSSFSSAQPIQTPAAKYLSSSFSSSRSASE